MSKELTVVSGRIGKKPEYTKGDDDKKSRLTFSVAEQKFKPTADGKGYEDDGVKWHQCAMWDSQADRFKNSYSKGEEVIVAGQLSHHEYEGKTYETLNVEKMGSVPQVDRNQDQGNEKKFQSNKSSSQSQSK